MEQSDQQWRQQFVAEVWRRYEEVQQWAMANWPDPEHPLSSADFVEARKAILALGQARHADTASAAALEPVAGGPQYQDVTPAPWP